MIDKTSGQPIRVIPGSVYPHIWLPYEQLDKLRQLLDRHHVPYSVRENIISLSGGPLIAKVYLGRDTDENAVQSILDSAP